MPSLFTAAAGPLSVLLTDTAIRQRSTSASDDALGETVTWEDSEPLPCLLDRTARVPVEQVGGGGVMQAVESWSAAFPLGTDIEPADRLLINGHTYEVVETNAGQTTAAVLAVDLVTVQ